MAKKKSNDDDIDDDEVKEKKIAPWAIEIEFYNKPSLMYSVLEITATDDLISIVRDDESVIGFPSSAVCKILVIKTKKK